MSGLAGVYYRDARPVESELLDGMNRSLVPRGSDASGIWSRGSVGFTHRMFWTTPESIPEKLPFFDEKSRLAITADARVDNREELLEIFYGKNENQTDISDSALILKAYQKWGETCPDKILGDFAFAIWDENKKQIFCARDIFGIKPFYYFKSDRLFAFASEIKALFCCPEIEPRLNETMIGDFLLWSGEDKEITFYENIRCLAPAHSLTIAPRQIVLKKYWSLELDSQPLSLPDRECEERFRELFKKAVDCRLRSAFPAGSLLSGGLDSSSIVSMAGSVNTFSLVFDQFPECDEREFIQSVNDLPGKVPHEIQADSMTPLRDPEVAFRRLDGPYIANLSLFQAGVYPEAQKRKVRVLLDGYGGDEVVGRGYAHLTELLSRFRWGKLFKEARALSEHLKQPVERVLWQKALRPLMPAPVWKAWRQVRWRGKPLWMDGTAINRDFAKKIKLKRRAEHYLGYQMQAVLTVRQEQQNELSSGLIPENIIAMNHLSAPFSIEHRYPFFDRRLVEFCFSLPARQKLEEGWTRALMRRSLKDILPEKVRRRGGKIYMGGHLIKTLRNVHEAMIRKEVIEETEAIAPYMELAILKECHNRFLKNATHEDATLLWQATLLSLWLKSKPCS